jgi:hypothetical protein
MIGDEVVSRLVVEGVVAALAYLPPDTAQHQDVLRAQRRRSDSLRVERHHTRPLSMQRVPTACDHIALLKDSLLE